MARRTKVTATIVAEDKASRSIAKVQTRFQKLSGFVRKNLVLSLASATAAFLVVSRAMKAVISASSEQEDAINSLNASLASLGPAADGVSASLQKQASDLQKITTAGDEVIIRGQALVASFNRNEDVIKASTVAALDLAAATGTDLKAAFLLMGKAAAGETSSLSRYGIVIEEGLAESEKFAAVIAKITEQFGGQAQAKIETFSGRVAQLTNAWGDQLEKVGDLIVQNGPLADTIEGLTKFLTENSTALAKTVGLLGTFIEVVKAGLRPLVLLGEGLGRLTSAFVQWSSSTELVSIRTEVLARQAGALGITVEQLKARFLITAEAAKKLAGETKNVEAATLVANAALEKSTVSAGDLAAAYDKAVESVKAFGAVTSVQLEQQIFAISIALLQQKSLLGETSREYTKLAENASEKIELLNRRIESLRDGLGDLNTSARESAGSFAELGNSVDGVTRQFDESTRAIDNNNSALERNATATTSSAGGNNLLIGTSFGSQGTFTFRNGRRVFVTADGRIIP